MGSCTSAVCRLGDVEFWHVDDDQLDHNRTKLYNALFAMDVGDGNGCWIVYLYVV